MAKVGVQESVNKEKLETLHSQLEEVMGKREELTVEINRITTRETTGRYRIL